MSSKALQISTVLGPEFQGDPLAFFVKCAIDGFARGSVPMAHTWRLPPLYASGIRYQPEPNHGSGNEDFALPATTYQRRWGDCDDLVIYRIWELLCSGEQASCAVIYLANANHVRVRRGPAQRPRTHRNDCQCERCIEDPSILCGAKP